VETIGILLLPCALELEIYLMEDLEEQYAAYGVSYIEGFLQKKKHLT